MDKIITPIELFFTGKPCRKGHICNRYVSSGKCVECNIQNSKNWYHVNQEKAKISAKKWRENHPNYGKEHREEFKRKHPEIVRKWSRDFVMLPYVAPTKVLEECPPGFKEVPGYPGYYASEDGRIFSGFCGRELKQCNAAGYFVVGMLSKAVKSNSKSTSKHVHKLVALAWLPEPTPEQTDINHLDYNKKNNHASNLKWCTKSQNVRYSLVNRKNMKVLCYSLTRAEADEIRRIFNPIKVNRTTKITAELIDQVFSLWKVGEKPNNGRTVAKKLGIDSSTVSIIVRKRITKDHMWGLNQSQIEKKYGISYLTVKKVIANAFIKYKDELDAKAT